MNRRGDRLLHQILLDGDEHRDGLRAAHQVGVRQRLRRPRLRAARLRVSRLAGRPAGRPALLRALQLGCALPLGCALQLGRFGLLRIGKPALDEGLLEVWRGVDEVGEGDGRHRLQPQVHRHALRRAPVLPQRHTQTRRVMLQVAQLPSLAPQQPHEHITARARRPLPHRRAPGAAARRRRRRQRQAAERR